MDKIDITTISVVFILIQILFALGFTAAAFNDKHKYMDKLSIGILLNTIGLTLLITLSYNWFFGVFLGNTLLLVGYIFYIRGVFKLLQIESSMKEIYIALFVHTLVYLYLIFGLKNIRLIIFVFGIESFILGLYLGIKVLTSYHEKKYAITLLLAITSIVFGSLNLIRGISIIIIDIDGIASYRYLFKSTFLVGIASNIILYLSVVLISTKLSSEKLLKVNKDLLELVSKDYLTKSYNTRSIINSFKLELERVRRYNALMSLAIIDIDHFKDVNDSYGHLFGDKVLVELSKVFMQNLNNEDIFGRYGGEEFIILMPDTTIEEGEKRIKVIQQLLKKLQWDKDKFVLTFSGGIIEINAKTKKRDVRELLKDADKLLHLAKKRGRDRLEASKTEEKTSQLKLIKG